jgi:hypothetical protein
VIDHVLSRFGPDEQAAVDEVLDAAADAVLAWARDGVDRTANRWNAWRPASTEDAPAPDGDGTPRSVAP